MTMNKATESVTRSHKEIKLNEKDIERFWKKVDKSGGPDACWLWIGSKIKHGYGCFVVDKTWFYPHRIAWTLTHGQIPHSDSYHGTCVCHDCPSGENPACCNPAHLFLGSQGENMKDMIRKGRDTKALGEDNGISKLTAAQVIEIRSLYAAGNSTLRQLGSLFGVRYQNISLIINYKAWKHVRMSP